VQTMEKWSCLTQAVTNPREYTGRQVVERFRLLDIEIFDLLRNGLQAYMPGTYKRIVDEDNLEKRRTYSAEEIERLEYLNEGKRQTGIVFTECGHYGTKPPIRTDDEIKRDAKYIYEKQLKDIPIVPEGCETFSFSLPDDNRKRQAARDKALSLIFKPKDVEEYEQTHGIPHEGSLPPAPQEQAEKRLDPENAFIHQDNTWEIWFKGGKLQPIIHVDGITYIASLLMNPNLLIHVTDLCNSVNPQNKTQAMINEDDLANSVKTGNMFISNMQDDELDQTWKENLQRKIKDLKETIRDNDLPVSERNTAQEEYDQIIKTLSAQFGKNPLGSKRPKKLNESVKKDLDRAGKAISRAIEKIRKPSPELADYLGKTIKTGTRCIFTDTGTSWYISI
jgi:hypothetical protein